MSTPEFLGPYRLGETLGRGGMGTVYRGKHEKTGEWVAVKLIAPNVADDIKFRRRFDAEVESLKRLRHENIVRLIGYGEEKGQLFYSMELVEGEPLQKRVRREKRLGWMTTIDIAIQICSALKHAHDIGVIHRDLKPANLVLTHQDQVKLVDFGIAKIFGASEQTLAGSVMGTADYMAPEQANGDGITLRSDLYALGSVMYAMTAGRAPFKGKKITEVIAALQRDKPIPLEMIVPDLPDSLVELIHHLLEKDPHDRPPTALAVMNRLKAMRNGLMREQTLLQDRDQTEVRQPLDRLASTGQSSLPDFDTPPRDSKITPVSGIELRPTPAGKATTAAEHRTSQHNPASRLSGGAAANVDHSAGTIQKSGTHGGDATVVGHAIDQDTSTTHQATHFQTVGQSPSASGLFQHSSDATSRATQILSIAAIIGLLVLGALVIAYSLKKPSAEELYEQIIAATTAGTLSDARPEIDQFLKLYPDDQHFGDVQMMDLSLQRDSVIRRLELQSKLPGRTLDPHEQAFLEAMKLRPIDPLAAEKQLQQWLDVFVDSTTHADDTRKQMADLVTFERDRLALQDPNLGADKRNQQLIDRIAAADELAQPERTALLEGIIDLYSDSQWARPAVELAKERLAETQ